jgi:hypothetical protein
LRPFAWDSFLRVTLAAVIAETAVVNFRYLTPHLEFNEFPALSPGFLHAPAFMILAAIAALVALDLVLLAWHAVIRLRITLFHALVYESPRLRDGWVSCGKAADRLFRASLLASVAILVLIGLVILAVGLVAFGVFTLRTPDGKFDVGVFLTMFFPTLALAVAVLVAAVMARVVLHDFILPHVMLENATVREAWRSVRKRIRADREGFFSYFLLRFLFTILAVPLLAMVAFLALWPVFWALGASAAGYNALLDDATGIAALAGIALHVILLLAGAAIGICGAALFGGPLAVFLRAHALCFYGSRFKVLGDLLSEQVAVTAEVRSA